MHNCVRVCMCVQVNLLAYMCVCVGMYMCFDYIDIVGTILESRFPIQ